MATDSPFILDTSSLSDVKPIDTTSLALKVSRMVAEAQESLLQKWVADGLPLERAEPKYELGPLTEDNKIPVRVWIEWREKSDGD